ncbi:MAG: glycosyltransferase [Bacteroidaceae bacterium]|nr:glycosyltransferase [Bacteroidaceae bacterium]
MIYYLLAATGLLFVIQLLYLLLLYNAPARQYSAFQKNTDCQPESPLPPLSVIITVSNQDYLLQKNLPAVLEQDYPDFEVIIVDDNSTDETADILQQLQYRYPRLRTTFVPPTSRRISHRKLALTLGIKAAVNEWLVFTDADCRPASNQWLRCLASRLQKNSQPKTESSVDAVIGYTGYERSRFDIQLRGLRLLGLATHGKAHMAYGTNLLYRRSIFFDAKGYSSHLHLERGDDDIFVNAHIRPRSIRAAVGPDATILCTDNTRRHWRLERMGRLATRRYLRGIQPFVLSFDTLTRILYLAATLATILACIFSASVISLWWIPLTAAAVLWAVRYALGWIVWNRAARALGDKAYGPVMPLMEVWHPIQELSLRIQYLFSSKQRYRRKQL